MLEQGLSLALVGDVMLGGRALEALRRMGAEAMARLIWEPVGEAEVIVANLEAPITEVNQVRENKRYNLSATKEILDLFNERFVVGLANNHILDYGEKGLLETLDALNERGIVHTGAGRDLDEARRPAIKRVGDLNLAVFAAADSRWQAATEMSAGVFPAREELLRESLQDIAPQVDEVVVSIHAGTEFISVPSPAQLRLAEQCLEEGARVVSFHHAHCLGGVERAEKGIVLYGTGNYVFPNSLGVPFSEWDKGAVWRITLPESCNGISRLEIVPVLLNGEGLPESASGKQAEEILAKVEKHSRRLQGRFSLSMWRLSEMLRPQYLRLNAVHYADIVRRQGALGMMRALWQGVQTQLR